MRSSLLFPVVLLPMLSGCIGDRPQVRDFGTGVGAAPSEVIASTTDEAKVTLRWSPPKDLTPDGYVIQRDGVEIATLDANTLSYEDTSSSESGMEPPANVSATNGTLLGVRVSWSPPRVFAGSSSFYVVAARYGIRRVGSAPIDGHRAAPKISGYEVSADDGATWRAAGDANARTYDDSGALGALTLTTTASADIARGSVRLAAMTTFGATTVRLYRVRARSSLGPSPHSRDVEGSSKGSTAVELQWERSAGDSDTAYADLAGVVGRAWDDVEPVAGEGRWYRAHVTGLATPVVSQGTRVVIPKLSGPTTSGLHVCALDADGHAICWGYNSTGQAPPGPSVDTFKQLAAGSFHTCGVRTDDKLACWGTNTSSQAPPGPSAFSVKMVAAGSNDTCWLAMDGKPTCVGATLGGLGSLSDMQQSYVTIGVENGQGPGGGCGIRASDGVWACWGSSIIGGDRPGGGTAAYTELSRGSPYCARRQSDGVYQCYLSYNSNLPGTVPAGFKTFGSGSGLAPACGLDASGKIVCYGGFDLGPTPPAEAYDDLAMSDESMCALRAGRMQCWGDNTYGQAPPLVPNETFVALTAARATCAMKADGRVHCFGFPAARHPADTMNAFDGGEYHYCGIRKANKTLTCWTSGGAQPALSVPGGTYDAIAAAPGFGCAISTTGSIACWGSLGWPATEDVFTAIAAGGSQACAIRDDAALLCNGVAVSQVSGAKRLCVGSSHACAIDLDDHVVCWGDNTFQQAPGAPSVDSFTEVTCGDRHSCALRSDGTITCWGDNASGQAPTTPSEDVFTRIAAGYTHTCGIRYDGRLVCWGDNKGRQAPQP